MPFSNSQEQEQTIHGASSPLQGSCYGTQTCLYYWRITNTDNKYE